MQLKKNKFLLNAFLTLGLSSFSFNLLAADKVYDLDVNNWQPSTHHYTYNAFEPWKKLVEEKTDGRVKVHIHSSSALGKSTSVYQDVRGGLYDVGIAIPLYFYESKFFPLTIGNLPFALNGFENAAKVLDEFSEKYALEELSKDLIVMPSTASDSYDIFSTKPIRKVEDFKDLKVRMGGKSDRPFVKELGAVAVSLPVEDIYEGLDKGIFDVSLYSPIGASALRLNEAAPYITKIGLNAIPLIPIMNKDFFESLPEDLQTLFVEELNPVLPRLITESYSKLLGKADVELQKSVAKKGEYIELSDEVIKEFQTKSKVSWDQWIEDANKKGYDGQKMVDDYLEILDKHGYDRPF